MESFSALIVSLGTVGLAAFILYRSYQAFLNPTPLNSPIAALITLLACGAVSTYRASQMRGIANRSGLLSLRANANNSIKDATASFVVFASVLGASLGVYSLDAIGGMIISIYIFAVAYVAIRESTLILLDACESPEMVGVLTHALRTVEGVRSVGSIRLRPSGPFLTGIISILVDGGKTISETEELRKRLLDVVSAVIEPVGEISFVFRPEAHS